MLNTVELLKALVAIDSRTPGDLNDVVPPGTPTEETLALFLQRLLTDDGWQTTLQELAPRRPALVAWTPPIPGVPTLAFEAHLDTVGVDGMTHPPFTGELRNGRLYARGAADTKGPMAAMLVALDRLRRAQLPLNLVFVGCAAEETGCEGAMKLDLSRWHPDAIVIGEPTSNQPIIGHKGHLWLELTATGKAAHASNPEAGDNALYRMTEVIAVLRRYHAQTLAPVQVPGFSPSTLAVTMIHGGVKVNIIPEKCRIRADLRLVPTFDVDAVLADLVASVQREVGPQVTLTWRHSAPAFNLKPGSRLLPAFERGLVAAGGQPRPTTVNYCTDAGPLCGKGYDCVVFGPGNILQAHAAEEYISLAELEQAPDILFHTGQAFAAGRA